VNLLIYSSVQISRVKFLARLVYVHVKYLPLGGGIIPLWKCTGLYENSQSSQPENDCPGGLCRFVYCLQRVLAKTQQCVRVCVCDLSHSPLFIACSESLLRHGRPSTFRTRPPTKRQEKSQRLCWSSARL